MDFEIKIQGDSDGYVAFECPFCESQFKLNAGEFQNDDNNISELCCPYCGLMDKVNKFYTKEVIEQAQAIAMNYMSDELNKAFGKMSKSLNKSNLIKMSYKPLKKINVKDVETKDTVEEIFECHNCHNHVKVLYGAGVSKVFCSYCGNDI
ncbi:MAG: hypothetical protein PHD02_04945 [Bacilli bacterium]|nr:hypothetical protein [Bacilli bacterium]